MSPLHIKLLLILDSGELVFWRLLLIHSLGKQLSHLLRHMVISRTRLFDPRAVEVLAVSCESHVRNPGRRGSDHALLVCWIHRVGSRFRQLLGWTRVYNRAGFDRIRCLFMVRCQKTDSSTIWLTWCQALVDCHHRAGRPPGLSRSQR